MALKLVYCTCSRTVVVIPPLGQIARQGWNFILSACSMAYFKKGIALTREARRLQGELVASSAATSSTSK